MSFLSEWWVNVERALHAMATSCSFALGVVRIVLHRLCARDGQHIRRERRLLCLGLDGAGKSALLAPDGAPAPTRGFAVRSHPARPDWTFDVCEVGGAAHLRPYWHRYATADVAALLFVVSAADEDRWAEARESLESILRFLPTDVPLAVLANAVGANAHEVDTAHLGDELQLSRLCSSPGGGPLRPHCIIACAAPGVKPASSGLSEGLEWVGQAIEEVESRNERV